MSESYEIHPIACATMEGSKGAQIYLAETDVTIHTPVIAFLLVSVDRQTAIMVDTGIAEADDEGTVRGYSVEGGGPDPIRDALDERGLEPGDVDHVILTHLHFDHADNVELFPDAEVLVQRAELAAARDPLPAMEFAYADDVVATLDSVDLTVVDGGYRLRPGIELLHTPGHTRGQQSVVVRTETQPHAIVSDLAYSRYNLQPDREAVTDARGRTIELTPRTAAYYPPGILVDMEACHRSVERVRERIGPDGTMLAGHFPDVLDRTYPGTSDGS